jgi:MOSC domain-containing protein
VHVKELWRYPVKSMAGERIKRADVELEGINGDRTVLVVRKGKVVTARTDYRLLGLRGTFGDEGVPKISGYAWDSPQALALVQAAAGPEATLLRYQGVEVFDVLPLLVATDGAIQHLGIDGRRLRPNIVIGGVPGLQERAWPGRRLRIGEVIIQAVKLRGRCVMTTYDPDTLRQDHNVLRRIGDEFEGRMALDCAVVQGGVISEGDPVTILEDYIT